MKIDHPEYMEATQEFFIRVIEEASQVDNGDILFRSLKSDKGSYIMEMLVKVRTLFFYYGLGNIKNCMIASD